MTARVAGIQRDVEVLKAERAHKDQRREDLTGAARRKPAVYPGEEHAAEEDVHRRKNGHGDERIRPKPGQRHPEANSHGRAHQSD